MKLVEKRDSKLIIETTSEETQLIKGVLLNAGGFLMDHDTTIVEDELRTLRELITDYYKKDVSRDRGSEMELTGRQLNMIKDATGEALREIASFEFSLRHPGSEEDAARMLLSLKQIQDETKEYGAQ